MEFVGANLPDYKILFGIVIVVVLLLIYIAWRDRTKRAENATGKKDAGKKKEKKRERNVKHQKSRKEPKPQRNSESDAQDKEDFDSDDAKSDDSDRSDELYNLVHDRMVGNMKSEEFLDVAGDMADNLTFVELKQLYNNARNNRQDPSTAVTVEHYSAVLKKREEG